MTLVLGAIADDFTGATDLANTLVREDMRVTQVIGIPDGSVDTGEAEAVVIALKSRTSPAARAVADSGAALNWLREAGARQVLFQFCSTFDSTPQGNIGPVADELLRRLDAEFALICPAFPENGRTVYQGHLFVGDRLLADSSMKDHPLTPMRDSNLIRLMEAQSAHRAGLIPLQVVSEVAEAIRSRMEDLKAAGFTYGVADAIDTDDLRRIGAAARGHALVAGGSGIATGLPENLRSGGVLGAAREPGIPTIEGRSLVLAGSCSSATRGQIARVAGRWPTLKIDVDAIAAGGDVAQEAADWALVRPRDTPVLIYGSADPAEVAETQAKYGTLAAGDMVERTLSGIATRLVGRGFTRLVAAGGETSGAVVSALGIRALRIGPEIAPGVPWTQSMSAPPIALALKSGNFGASDFSDAAFGMLP